MNGSRLFRGSLILLVLVAGSFAAWRYFASQKPIGGQDPRTGTVGRGNVIQRATMIGSIKSNKTLVVRASYKGFIRKIFVKVGDTVKVGTPLVSIAQSADQPEAEIFPLRSTMSGKVTQIQSSEGESVGEVVNDEDFILRVDDMSRYSVSCDTPEVDVVKLKVGQKALVRPSAVNDREYSGRIDTINMSSTAQDRWNRGMVQFKVEVGITEPIDALPGMTAMVDVIAAERKDVLIIEHEYVEPEAGKYFVSLADGQKVEIKVGLRDETSFEVLEGLKEGQKVRQVDFVAATRRNRGKM